ncbi:MBG domain-containing protein [Pedobacter hartonius]|uniref:Gliding motility-associated C-terminal domain-containing protein n=1 Tax=Pedobacter hartonius TaxID=425514 RepID=A0A1H3XGB2_9SPHI|nr:MBG domain-containing protein [Pedobacter hartonius]SDZ97662.1 gliding motility-associated C-terminal domain-containing protein [Pedobacter hartonius]
MKFNLSALLLFLIAFNANAQMTNFSGNLLNSQIFTRPDLVFDDGINYDAQLNASDLKPGSGTYNYYVQNIIPSVTGTYTIDVSSAVLTPTDVAGNTNDTYLFVYSGNFNYLSPLTNLVRANDDFSNLTVLSRVTNLSLTAGTVYYLVLSSYTSGQTGPLSFSVTGPANVTVGGPVINTLSNMTPMTGCSGSPSTSQSFTVDGSNLTGNIALTAPTGFEISTTPGGIYGGTLMLTPTAGSVALTTVYARLAATATGTPAGSITVSSGTTTKTVALSGTVNTTPSIVLGSITPVNSVATSFAIPYTVASGSPNQYSITTGGITPMPGFSAVSNATLGATPITVTIPASAANTYNFSLTVRNSVTGCTSPATPFTVTIVPNTTTVSSILRASPDPTSAATVNYTVTFAGAVTGVDAADFALTATASAAAAIGTPAGSGTTWTVPVNSITGDGTIRLDFTGLTGVTPNVSSAYITGDVYTIDHTPPVVSSVSSTALDATYMAGANLNIQVSFPENVTATGTPQLALNSGGTASYASGSGTGTLTFSYTVGAGDSSPDLDYTATSSLSLAGGTLTDAAGNNAALTLPAVGGASSLGGQKAIVIDGIAPVVSNVAVPANGSYGTGQNLDFTVNMSEAVTVNTGGGIPAIAVTLNTGGTVNAAYLSGSGTSALTFRYTVATGNADNDGIILSSVIALNGGTLKDAAGNNAVLTLNNPGMTTGILVDGVAPVVSTIAIVGPAATNAASVEFTVTFSESVSGADISDFITTGSVAATIASISPVSGSVYTVTVNSITGAGILRLDLNSTGTGITDVSGNPVSGGFITGDSYNIDRVTPVVATVNVPANATYIAGQNLDFTVNFDEAVNVTGSPYLGITLNTGGTVQAAYLSGSGTTALTFHYTVVTGNLDNDGIIPDAAVTLNGGTILDNTNNIAVLTLNGVPPVTGILVDAVAPVVSSVAVPVNGNYGAGQDLDFIVNTSETVTVGTGGGTPFVEVTLNTGGTVNAFYLSGSGTPALTFRYTVAAGNADNDGIVLAAAITPNGGTLRDAAGNDAIPGLNNPGVTTAILVDGIAPVSTSVAVPANASYGTGQYLDFMVNMTEMVTVNTTTGIPSIDLTLNTGGTVQAAYLSGSGTAALTFRYTIAAGNTDNDGIILANTIVLNGGTLKDAAGNNAVPALNNLGTTTAVLVDGNAPVVSTIARVGAALTNAASVDYTVTFSEDISGLDISDFSTTATGSAAGTIAAVNPVSGSVYTVTVNSITGDGTLRLDLNNTGTGITDIAANPLNGGFITGEAYTVDRITPVIATVGLPANATYVAGQNLDLTLNLSENVTVTGAPVVGLTLNTGGAVNAVYLSGSGTAALTFRYTVVTGDLDDDGITLASAPVLSGGTITDDAGNPADLTLNGIAPTTGILVDAAAPVVSSVTVPANGNYGTGQNLDFTVNFSENTTVSTTGGIPSIDLTLNTGGTVQAAYLSGSGTAALTFRYTVAAGNTDHDGVILANTIALNGGTLKDAAGNDAIPVLNNTGATTAVLVDGTAPVVTAIARVSAALTNAASLDYTVTFSENISGLEISDFTATATGSATGTVAAASPVSGSVYTVTVSSITGLGTLRLDLNNAGTGIIDIANNPVSSGFNTGELYTIDRVIPTLSAVTITSNNVQPTKATTGDVVTVTFSSDETLQTPVVSITGHNATVLNTAGNNWTATYTLTASDTEGNVPFSIDFSDLAANAGITVTSGTGSVTFDKTAPAIPSGLAATSGNTQIQLNWTADTETDLAGYSILYGTSPAPATLLTTIPAGTTTYTHTGLSNGITYFYRILATDQTGNSSTASADVTAIPKAGQTITFNTIAAKTYGDADFTLGAANSSAGLPVTYTATDPAIVAITGNTAKILKAGSTVITASQPGNAAFNPAPAVPQTLSTGLKDLTIVNTSRAKVYGDVLTNTDFSGSVTGIVNNDNITLTRSSTGAAASATTGTYPIVAALSDPDLRLSNYNLNNPDGTLTVTQKALVITAADRTKIYGETVTFAATAFTATGLINGNTVSTVTLSSSGSINTATVAGSPYTIVPSAAAGTGLSNYLLSYTNGTLTLNRKSLVVTADNKEKFTGTANPVLTASFNGFANNENSAVFTAAPVISSTADINSPIGTYPISVSNAAAANYVTSFVNGTLTVKAGAPAGISLAAAILFENQASGTNAGTLSSTSDDANATFSYTLVSGAGDADNGLFSISGNQLRSAAPLNFEQKAVYSIRVRSATQYGFSLDKVFSINLSDVNEIPALDAVANQVLCYITEKQNIALTGISAGPETSQTSSLTVNSDNNLLENLTVTTTSAGAGVLSYRIKDGASGTARVTVTVKDNGGTANGGSDTYTRDFTITINPLPAIVISSDQPTELSKGLTAKLTASGGSTYLWSTSAGIIGGQQTATLTVRPSVTTTYTVTVTNTSGCSAQQSITLNVLEDYKTLDATNILSPNGDGQNDFWMIRNIDLYPNNEVKVFDKAGRILFSQKHYQNTWDATINGSPLSEGTYYYIVDFGAGLGKMKGFITVIRQQ